MLDDYIQEKADFAESLTETLRGINEEVSGVGYSFNAEAYDEIVSIEFCTGYKKFVNVTGDSLKALAIDVIEAL